MIYIGFIIVALIAFGVGMVLVPLVSSIPGERALARGVLIVATALFIGGLTLGSVIRNVPAGHVGLVYSFGNITGQRSAGFQMIPPWSGMKIATIQIQRIKPDGKCDVVGLDNCLGAFSKETQDVFVQPTLNISVNPNDVQNLYRNVGAGYLSTIVRPRLLQIIKDETVKYTSIEIAPNREVIRVAVRDRLQQELSAYSITVNDLLLDNLEFRPEFKDAIEQKQIATQNALKEQANIGVSQAQAAQVAAAAQGAADKLRIEAQGQADANRSITASITPLLIQWQAIQKLADKIQIMLVPSGSGFLIDPSKLLGSTP